jgi:hypothetical protein
MALAKRDPFHSCRIARASQDPRGRPAGRGRGLLHAFVLEPPRRLVRFDHRATLVGRD